MSDTSKDIFERFRTGEAVLMDDPGYSDIRKQTKRTFRLSSQMNASGDINKVRSLLSEIIGTPIDTSTVIFPPFYINYGGGIALGKNVFINHGCSFLDLGGITIEDDVMIGPNVNITSEDHPVEVETRKTLVPAKVLIRKNAWIGAAATILPGVTVGENSVVGAGAVVTKDVPDNTVVAGVPAKVIRQI